MWTESRSRTSFPLWSFGKTDDVFETNLLLRRGSRRAVLSGGEDVEATAPTMPSSTSLLFVLRTVLDSVRGGLALTVVPMLFVAAGMGVGSVLQPDLAVRGALEQIAGGLLLWTWVAKVYSPTAEAFKKRISQTDSVSRWVLAWNGVLLVCLAAPAAFVAMSSSSDAGQPPGIDSVWSYGLLISTPAGRPVENYASDAPNRICAANSSAHVQASRRVRANSVHQTSCHAVGSPEQRASLFPFYVDFALDGFVLVLIDWEGVLARSNRRFTDNLVAFLVIPIALSVDNLLTGAGLYEATSRAYPDHVVWVGAVYCACVPIGWLVGTGVRVVYEGIGGAGLSEEIWRCGLLLAAGLSFLVGGLELIHTGFTFWVGMGGAVGWLLLGLEWAVKT